MKKSKLIQQNPNETRGDLDERESTARAEVCPICGMERQEWKGGAGRGYEISGDTYCCQGCAEGADCTCKESEAEDVKPMD